MLNIWMIVMMIINNLCILWEDLGEFENDLERDFVKVVGLDKILAIKTTVIFYDSI